MFKKKYVLIVLAVAASLPLLPGCSPFMSGPAPDMYILSPKSTFKKNLPTIDSQLVIALPTTGRALNTDRIAVKPTPDQFKYYEGARWTSMAPMMIQTLLVESFENTGHIEAVGRQAISLRPDFVLVSELREFQAQRYPDKSQPPTVLVRLSVKCINQPRARIIDSDIFSAQFQATGRDMTAIVHAFDDAMGRVLKKTVTWCMEAMAKFEAENAEKKAERANLYHQ